MNNKSLLTFGFLSSLVLAACGANPFGDDTPPPLPGERISVLELQKTLEPDDPELAAQGLVMPPAWTNEYWPQAGGYPNHSMQNLALSEAPLKRIWKADIGEGASNDLPLTARPIIADGRIFTLDTEGTLSAFNIENGKALWRKAINNKDEDEDLVGGGMAFAEGVIYTTNGTDEVMAINPLDGVIMWRRALPGPARAAPTIINGRLFVTTLDSRLVAFDSFDGQSLWEYKGITEMAGLIGAASPAANNDIVVPAFSSGEITALRAANGSVTWTESLSSVRNFGGLSSIADIKALPVIDKGVIFAISFSGRLVAIDERTGGRIWQREIGGSQTPWLAGNHMFVLSSENKLVALGRDTGAVQWVTPLPLFDDEKPVVLNGPVLAGGRLFVAGSAGRVIEVSPENGEILRRWNAGDDISLPPIVAGQTLYLLANDGTLSAYR